MTRKIHFAVMAYGGELPVQQTVAVLTTIQQMTQTKEWNVSFHFRVGDSILPRARNAEASNFLLDEDATDMIMVDADTICAPEGFIKLIEADADIVGAPYRTRNEPLVWTSVRWLHQDVKPAENGLLECEAIGTGLFRITRKAMQAIWDAEPRRYKDPTCKRNWAKPLFWFEIRNGEDWSETIVDGKTETIVNGHMWGEDLTLCQRWRGLGGKVYTDPSITTSHMGQFAFTANLGEWLAQHPKAMKIDDIVGRISDVTNFYSNELGGISQPAVLRNETISEVGVAPPAGLHLPQLDGMPVPHKPGNGSLGASA